jgi:type I restriction enzyme S subunit
MMVEQMNNVPSLRFPEFDGEWQVTQLGDIFEYKNGGAFESYIVDDGQYNLITLNSIGINGKLKKRHKTVNDANWFLQKNDLIMVLSDVAHGNFLGLTDVIPEDNKFVLNQRMGLLRKKDSSYHLTFTRQLINNNQKYFKLHGQGSSQQNLSKGDILKFKIVRPSFDEQQKIASFLTSIDTRIQQLESKTRLLTEYKKGVMQQIFSQQIRFKDDNGNAYPDWEEKLLGELLAYEQPTKYLVSSTEYSDKHKTPVLTAGKTFILGYTEESDDIFCRSLPVIIFDDFTTANKFVNFPFKAKSSAMKILKPIGDEVNVKCVYEAMQLLKFHLGDHKRYWISEYQYLTLAMPSYEEQQKIANFLTSIDNKIEQVTAQFEQAKTFKKGLLQQMFV